MELRGDINSLLRKAKVPKSNLTKQEKIGLSQLKKDKNRVILTADKGVAMVIMDKEDYNNKTQRVIITTSLQKYTQRPSQQNKGSTYNKTKQNQKGN